MKFGIRFLTLLLPVALMGCSYITTPGFIKMRDNQYLKARSIPPLQIPPGIASSSIHNYYPVPNGYYSNGVADVSALPPGLPSK